MTTTLLVQTDRIRFNLNLLQKKLGGTAVIPVLSANAYGLGDTAVARILLDAGIRVMAVSRLDEAERLLNALPELQILLLTPYATEAEIRRIAERDIIATVGSNDCAVLLSGIAGQLGRKARCHLRFDLGNSSSGYLPSEAGKAAGTVKYLENLAVTGVYASLSAGGGEKRARAVYAGFNKILQDLSREGLPYGTAHLCSTAAALRRPWARLDAVRIGEGLIGSLSIKDKWGFKKVGRLVTEIADIRWIPKGSRVGSGSKKLSRAMRVATVPVGYADGLFIGRRENFSVFGNRKSTCEIAGERVQIIGKPGYTTTLVDVTELDCKPGDQISFEVTPCYVSAGLRREYV